MGEPPSEAGPSTKISTPRFNGSTSNISTAPGTVAGVTVTGPATGLTPLAFFARSEMS